MDHWIDIHTHLNMLEASADEAVKQAVQAGVKRVITIGTCPEDLPLVLNLSQQLSPHVYCTLGVHPHEAKLYDLSCEEFIKCNLQNESVVAVGEIGLDFHYDHSPRDVQKKVFRQQLQIAVDHKMPVEIHTREAEDETLEILKDFAGKVKAVLHCFTGTQHLAKEALDLGLDLSFSGVVTFKKADELREVVKLTPLERLHIETDAPFLTPVPFRGKKNTSAYVVHIAQKVAELKGVSMEQLAKQTSENAQRLFPKLKTA